MQEFTELANMLADEAGKIVRRYFRQPFDIITKEDASPVTVADKAIEARLREMIEERRPEDGILGEEFGPREGRSGYTWVIDPIDGTKSFIIGRPTFGTLIALCRDGVPVLGVIDQAVLGERWLGVKGEGATFNGRPVKTRLCPSLKEACAASTTPSMFGNMPWVHERFEKETKMMAWGGDCISYGLMALGYLDIIIEAQMNPHDYMALVPIVEEAGGKIADWRGGRLTMKSDGRVLATGDAELWEQARKLLLL